MPQASADAIRTATDPLRVLHLTDPHLFAAADGSLRGTTTLSTLQSVLRHIGSSGWQADLIAMTGDLIQDDSQGAYERFRDLFGPLGLPVLCIPGNHDIPELMQQVLAGAPFQYCGAIARNNWLITGIDTCIPGEAGGHIAPDELSRLRRQLADTDAEFALVCLHHPPLPVGSRWLDQVGLDNGDEFLELIASSGKVRAAIFGHVHQQFSADYQGVQIIGTPSTCRQFTVASDDFALDDNPPAYRRMSLHSGGRLDHELIWVEI